MNRILLWIYKAHRRRLLKYVDGPFDLAASRKIDALDALLEIMAKGDE
ncbi:MAG: hypothetical protein WC202_12260 [Desulfobacterales bacterium]